MTHRVVSVGVLAFALCAAVNVITAQQVPAPSATIIGRVLDAATGKPMVGVLVELDTDVALASGPRRQMTNAQGRFLFRALPAARFTIRTTVGGRMPAPNGFIQNSSGFPIGAYLAGGFGQRRPGGLLRPIVLTEGQSADAEIRMWRSATLAGSITDDFGDPLVDIVVGAAKVSSDGALLNGPTTRTDDRGMYRLSALEPGRYVVFVPQTQTVMPMETVNTALARFQELSARGLAAAPLPELTGVRIGSALVQTASTGMITGSVTPRVEKGAAFAFPTTFAPSSTTYSVNAAIDLKPGEDRTAVDVSVRSVATAAVSGTLVASGAPASGMTIHLMPSGAGDASLFEVAKGNTDSRGGFVFPAVPIGSYVMAVVGSPAPPTSPPPGAPTHNHDVAGGPGGWVFEPVGVPVEGVTGLTLSMRPGLSVRGRIEFEGVAPRPEAAQMSRLGVSVQRARPMFRSPDQAPMGLVDATSQFAAIGFPPGRYFLRPTPMQLGAWRVKSLEIGGRDVMDLPVDLTEDVTGVVLTFTDQPASVALTVGGVTDDAHAVVLLFPSDPSVWPDLRSAVARVRQAAVPARGDVTLSNVLPGDYLAIAVPEDVAAPFPDRALVTRLVGLATSVRVSAGQRTSISLTLRKP